MMRRNRKNVARNEAKSSFGHVRALSLGEIGESLRAKRWGRPWDEEVEDTGLFKTRVPRNAGHLVRNLVERQRTLPFLRSAPEFDDRAAASEHQGTSRCCPSRTGCCPATNCVCRVGCLGEGVPVAGGFDRRRLVPRTLWTTPAETDTRDA